MITQQDKVCLYCLEKIITNTNTNANTNNDAKSNVTSNSNIIINSNDFNGVQDNEYYHEKCAQKLKTIKQIKQLYKTNIYNDENLECLIDSHGNMIFKIDIKSFLPN